MSGEFVPYDPEKFIEGHDKPWSKQKRVVPLRTYSGRVVYSRTKHYFTLQDAYRILNRIAPQTPEQETNWFSYLMSGLRTLTLTMLDKILFFVPPDQVTQLYDWIHETLTKIFFGAPDSQATESRLLGLIILLSDKAGYEITLKKRG